MGQSIKPHGKLEGKTLCKSNIHVGSRLAVSGKTHLSTHLTIKTTIIILAFQRKYLDVHSKGKSKRKRNSDSFSTQNNSKAVGEKATLEKQVLKKKGRQLELGKRLGPLPSSGAKLTEAHAAQARTAQTHEERSSFLHFPALLAQQF